MFGLIFDKLLQQAGQQPLPAAGQHQTAGQPLHEHLQVPRPHRRQEEQPQPASPICSAGHVGAQSSQRLPGAAEVLGGAAGTHRGRVQSAPAAEQGQQSAAPAEPGQTQSDGDLHQQKPLR